MAAILRDWGIWLAGQATRTSARVRMTRYLGSLVSVGLVVWIIPKTPLDGPIGGVLALSTILVCSWFAGPGPSLLFPGLVVAMSRLASSRPATAFVLSPRELLAFCAMTVLTGAVGLAGQYRRRLKAATRRHAAKTLRQTQALSLARILFRDVDGRITTWTEGAERLFGWSSAEATGQLIQELLRTQFPKPYAEIENDLLRDGQWQGEVTQRRKDGRELVIATHWILYRGDTDAGDGVAEVHNDVTELRRAEATVRESERRKDLFVATLAHELRNPLAPIRSSLDSLRLMRTNSEETGLLFEIMGRQLEHMVRMVDDLLDVSRINTGKVELRRDIVVLEQVVTDAIAACRPQIDAAGHVLTVHLPDEPVQVHADAARLTQVLTNLLQNASKFTGAGGRITLSAQSLEKQVEIRVTDTGIGIPPELLSRVFDMFAQIQDVRARTKGGLGLGLSIVKSLTELHGGTVEVHSQGAGHGAEFVVRLPRITSQLEAGNGHLAESAPKLSDCLRVLVVDDNQDAARTLAMTLNLLGCNCRSSFDGNSALKTAEEFVPHAFVLDLGMPDMSGFELAKRLRAQVHFQKATLIAVTGWDKEEDRQDSKKAGFDYHFAKPVDVKMLQGLLQHARVERERETQGRPMVALVPTE